MASKQLSDLQIFSPAAFEQWAFEFWSKSAQRDWLEIGSRLLGEKCFIRCWLQLWFHSKAGFWANHRVRTSVSSKTKVFEQISGSISSAPFGMVEVRSGRYLQGLSNGSNDPRHPGNSHAAVLAVRAVGFHGPT